MRAVPRSAVRARKANQNLLAATRSLSTALKPAMAAPAMQSRVRSHKTEVGKGKLQ